MDFGNVDKLKLTFTVGKPKVSFITLFTFVIRNVWLAGAATMQFATSNTVRSVGITVAVCKD